MHRLQYVLPTCISAIIATSSTDAFTIPSRPYSSSPSLSTSLGRNGASSSLCLNALTERQMQFWEDVEDGLVDIEKFYLEDKGEDIERVKEFAKSAQGLKPPPTGSGPGHQPSEEHVDGLTARPFWDAASDSAAFPWASELESKAHIILSEFESKLKRDEKEAAEQKQLFTGDSAWQNNVMGSGWSAFRLQRLGEWNVENCNEFPETYNLLRSLDIPLAVRGVCFARQTPGTGVQPHSDGRNFILTSHLGLKVPEGKLVLPQLRFSDDDHRL